MDKWWKNPWYRVETPQMVIMFRQPPQLCDGT